MVPLGLILGGVNTGLGIFSALSAQSAKNRAQAAMDAAIRQAYENGNSSINNLRQSLGQNYATASGYGNDAIRSTAPAVQSGLANAGIQSGSVAAAGTLAAQRNVNTGLQNLAVQNQGQLGDREDSFNRYITGLKMGQAASNTDDANTNIAGAGSSLLNGIQSMAQFNLAGNTQSKPGTPGDGMNNGSLPQIQGMPSMGQYGGLTGGLGGLGKGPSPMLFGRKYNKLLGLGNM